jgi:hypothetical protein
MQRNMMIYIAIDEISILFAINLPYPAFSSIYFDDAREGEERLWNPR